MGAIDLRRHGDVMIKTYNGFKIPDEVTLKKETLLHQGEQHSHHFIQGECLVGAMGEAKFLRVVMPAVVDHAEHGKGDIPPGDYYIEIKMEYDHFLEESRQVVD